MVLQLSKSNIILQPILLLYLLELNIHSGHLKKLWNSQISKPRKGHMKTIMSSSLIIFGSQNIK
jgi:hypothetical protein